MKTIAFNSLNDMYRGADGNIAMLSGVDAFRQCCITAMQAVKGEMIYATDKGMPYFETVWNNYNPKAFEAAARVTLLAVPEAVQVASFQQWVTDDQLYYIAEIQSTFSPNPIVITNASS